MAAKKITIVSTLAAVLVSVVATLAFILSYSSLQHMAAQNGVNGWLSYLWPLLLDFSMIVFSLAILRANLRGEPALYPWVLTGIFATLATIANVLDVTTLGIPPLIVSASVKAIAPIALVLAFELLMSMLKAEVKRSNVVQSIEQLEQQLYTKQQAFDARLKRMVSTLRQRFTQERTALQQQLDKLQSQLDAKAQELNSLVSTRQQELDALTVQIEQEQTTLEELKAAQKVLSTGQNGSIEQSRLFKIEQDNADKQQRLNTLVDILRVKPGESVTALSEQLNVSRTTVYNDLSTLEGEGVLSKNGNGWGVTL